MELAMQFFSKEKILRSKRIQGLKVFHSQTVATQAKKESN